MVAYERRDLTAIDRAIELDPQFHLYELERARTLAFYGESGAVLVDGYHRALENYPASPEANARLGVEKARVGETAGVREHLDLAAAQAPLDEATCAYLTEGNEILGQPWQRGCIRAHVLAHIRTSPLITCWSVGVSHGTLHVVAV